MPGNFEIMFLSNSDGMLSWLKLSKKILKLLDKNKDRHFRKLLGALVPEKEKHLILIMQVVNEIDFGNYLRFLFPVIKLIEV